MDDKVSNINIHLVEERKSKRMSNVIFDFFGWIPQIFQKWAESNIEQIRKNDWKPKTIEPLVILEKDSQTQLELNLDKQMKAWKENNHWLNQPPEINVTVPKGSLCNLNLRVKVGLPPDAVFNIIIDPENKRVFKNIKEVISRKVLVDEDTRQVVEVEQAALWRFLWWSGTISVHVYVDQNRRDHTVKFKQGKSGFMKKFEGCWKIEPLFVDEQLCYPDKPETLAEYDVCTAGKGRVGSLLNLQQLIQPAIVPPPPISWYLRGITTKTTQMLINDLITEAARLRGGVSNTISEQDSELNYSNGKHSSTPDIVNIKERWCQRRRRMRKNRRLRVQTL
ncbi:putative START-like domain superfamily protein [Dioscorea sansibarensis]